MNFINTATSDNIIFNGLLSEPTTKSSTIIIHIHGMAGDIYTNSYYSSMHAKYPLSNIAFLAGEHRGTHSITQMLMKDGSVKNYGNTYEVFEDCIFDIQSWVNKAKELGYSDIWLQGHSLGPSKIVYYMSQNPDPFVKGLILLSPSDMIGLVNDPVGKKDHAICINEAHLLLKDGKGSQILSHDLWGEYRLSADTYVNFFGEKTNTAIFNFDNENLGWEKVKSIKVPVIAFTGTQDDGMVPVMDPYKAMKVFEEKLIGSPRKKTIVYENAKHSFDSFGDNIIKEVVEFIQDQQSKS